MACCNCFPVVAVVVAAADRKSMKFPDRTGTEAAVLWNLILRNEETNFPNPQRMGKHCLKPHIRLLMEQTAPAADWPRYSHMPDSTAGCIRWQRPAVGMGEGMAVVVVPVRTGTAIVGEDMRELMQPDTPVPFLRTAVLTGNCCC
jgi:hypothetical protein